MAHRRARPAPEGVDMKMTIGILWVLITLALTWAAASAIDAII